MYFMELFRCITFLKKNKMSVIQTFTHFKIKILICKWQSNYILKQSHTKRHIQINQINNKSNLNHLSITFVRVYALF